MSDDLNDFAGSSDRNIQSRTRLLKLVTDLTARAEAAEADLAALRSLCATAYQVVGACDGPVEVLDNLSAAASEMALPHDTTAGLPWALETLGSFAKRIDAAEADARRYRWLRDRPDGWRVMKFDGFGLDLDHVIDDAIDAELAKEGK